MAETANQGKKKTAYKGSGAGPGGYGLGFIGALVFYMQQAHSFGAVVVGILKAVVWPAFLVHHLFVL